MANESGIGSSAPPVPLQVLYPTQEGPQATAPTQHEREATTPAQQGMEQQGQDPPPSQPEVSKRKPCRPHSPAWAHFTKIKNEAVCNYCKKPYKCDSASHGTSNMLKHLLVCPKNPHRVVDKRQKTIALGKDNDDPDTSVSMKLVEFSQERTRIALAKMIVIDEQPFKSVENEGFRLFMSEACPRFKIPSRVTVAKDCMLLFNDEKEKLKSIFSANKHMISLTTDTWTSIQNLNYMVVTAHYIDEGWELHKKILLFDLICDHKGESIGKALERCLKDWGIKNVCCITVDNASANLVAIAYLIRGMSDWDGHTLLKGEYMHMRCAAHILNLIVSDGLKEIDPSIARIRAACKFVKGSPARFATFKRCAKEANINSKALLSIDVPTRWNSTYLMLDAAEKYEKAFNRLEYEDTMYVCQLVSDGTGCPTDVDWNRARVFFNFLKIFYDATLSFSGSLHVTANTFFKKLCDIQKSLSKWRNSDDEVLKKMTANMQLKFSKYWESSGINYLLFIAVFLDPRFKLDYIEFCFKRMYGPEITKKMLKTLKELVNKLFDAYVIEHPFPLDASESSSVVSTIDTQTNTAHDVGDDDDNWDDEFRLTMKKKQNEVQKNELERYLEDDVEDSKNKDFDILQWWKGKTEKYHVLSCMARDILAIPMSTISSESAFSTGGRVLDPFRSCLLPTTVQALVCTQNWIKKSTMPVELETEMNEVQHLETEISGLCSTGGGADWQCST